MLAWLGPAMRDRPDYQQSRFVEEFAEEEGRAALLEDRKKSQRSGESDDQVYIENLRKQFENNVQLQESVWRLLKYVIVNLGIWTQRANSDCIVQQRTQHSITQFEKACCSSVNTCTSQLMLASKLLSVCLHWYKIFLKTCQNHLHLRLQFSNWTSLSRWRMQRRRRNLVSVKNARIYK